jgi:hypothetical protein
MEISNRPRPRLCRYRGYRILSARPYRVLHALRSLLSISSYGLKLSDLSLSYLPQTDPRALIVSDDFASSHLQGPSALACC